MSRPGDGVTIEQLRRELAHLVSLADTAERPKPTTINPPGHPMPGHEWRIEQRIVTNRTSGPPTWWVRTVDDSETCGVVYVSSPDAMYPGEDFGCLFPEDARRLAMALLAAADRADHLVRGVPRLEDRRPAS